MPVTLAVVAADRLTKLMVADRLLPWEQVTVIPGFFDLVYIKNSGAAFGILAYMDDAYRVPVFAAATLAALGILAVLVARARDEDPLVLAALAMITGGALGNLYDRLAYGTVVDFIDWYIGSMHWPAFNLADSAITVGVILLAEEIIIRKKHALI